MRAMASPRDMGRLAIPEISRSRSDIAATSESAASGSS